MTTRNPEKLRIYQLVAANNVRPNNGSRLPVINIKPNDYSSQETINQICSDSQKTTLIIGHGKAHGWRGYFPAKDWTSVICLDLNPVAHPDLLGDMRNVRFMNQFPPNRFDWVVLCYLPPPSPFHLQNQRIFQNLVRLLKPGGRLKCSYLMKMYQRILGDKKGYTKKMIEDKVRFHASKYFTQVKFIRSTAIMIK